MQIKAILFGSIGVLSETSSMQRHAFNATFKEAGLTWRWEDSDYVRLLDRPNGRERIARHADERGESVDADALYARKTEIFREMLRHAPLSLRPGVADTIVAARVLGLRLGLVTTTSAGTIEAMLDSSEPRISVSDFDFVGHGGMVSHPKPAPDIYIRALDTLDLASHEALAVEDSPESAAAARAAGVPCVAFPGLAHAGRDFGTVSARLDAVSPAALGLDAALHQAPAVPA